MRFHPNAPVFTVFSRLCHVYDIALRGELEDWASILGSELPRTVPIRGSHRLLKRNPGASLIPRLTRNFSGST
jgi:hypothetical protein